MFAEAMDEVHQTPSGRDGGKQIFMFLCYLLAGMKHVTPSRHRCVMVANPYLHLCYLSAGTKQITRHQDVMVTRRHSVTTRSMDVGAHNDATHE